jgi:hypothetical protein
MQKSSINPEILQPMFEAAANAAEKGQSQYFLPLPFGRKLAEALPTHRAAIVDLNCGAGHLLQAAATEKTLRLLGADIDPCRGKSVEGATLPVHRITGDISRLFPLLKEVDFTANLFVLNPPWRLFLYRDRLAALAESALPAVRMAFQGIETGNPASNPPLTAAIRIKCVFSPSLADLCYNAFDCVVGAQLQALRIAAADPSSRHLPQRLGSLLTNLTPAGLYRPGGRVRARGHEIRTSGQ